jgi:hypothetical protein
MQRQKRAMLWIAVAALVLLGTVVSFRLRSGTSASAGAGAGEDVADDVRGESGTRLERSAASPTTKAAAAPATRAEAAAGSGAPEPAALAPVHPVVLAIRGKHQSLDEKRAAMISALEASGPSDESWTRGAADTFEAWKERMPQEIRSSLVLRSVRCFQSGCAVDVELGSAALYEAAAKAFRTLRDDGTSHGGRVQTPAQTLGGGRVMTTWMMLRPDALAANAGPR